jgi:hypothetical protein
MTNHCKKNGKEMCKDPENNVPCGSCVLMGCPQSGIKKAPKKDHVKPSKKTDCSLCVFGRKLPDVIREKTKYKFFCLSYQMCVENYDFASCANFKGE